MHRRNLGFVLMLVSIACAQDALPAFQRVSGLPHAVVLQRMSADARWDLVAALASSQSCEPAPHPCWWTTKDRLGILLLDRNDPSKMQPLAIEPGPADPQGDDCSARIERFTLQELVVSCTGEKGTVYDNQKFVYDVPARKLVSHTRYAPFTAERVLPGPQFVMSNRQRRLLMDLDPATGDPRVTALAAPPPPAPEPPLKLPPLPQTDLQTWMKARPDEVKSYQRPEQAEIHEEIGPHQMEGGHLWFGKTFYNGEGCTGLGGCGYFDAATASYRLIVPPEIYEWAVSAILVEPDAVWLALYHRGEYGDTSGGLLRWDRNTTQVQRWRFANVATSIARTGDAIYLGATDGILRIRGDRVSSYFIDRSPAGRYIIAAR